MKKVFVVLPIIVSLTACGSLKYNGGVEVKSESPFSSSPKPGDEVKYPSWFTEKKDDGALYAVATEYSKDMQFSVDKATLSAKRQLASNFSSHVSAMMKDYATEIGDDSSVMRDIDRTTKLIVNKVNMVGVQRTNFKIEHDKDGYRTWIQLRYAIDDTNKLLMEEIKRNRQLNMKLQASKSFRELQRETEERVEAPVVEEQRPQARIQVNPIDPRPVDTN
jgi:hypothetical protein